MVHDAIEKLRELHQFRVVEDVALKLHEVVEFPDIESDFVGLVTHIDLEKPLLFGIANMAELGDGVLVFVDEELVDGHNDFAAELAEESHHLFDVCLCEGEAFLLEELLVLECVHEDTEVGFGQEFNHQLNFAQSLDLRAEVVFQFLVGALNQFVRTAVQFVVGTQVLEEGPRREPLVKGALNSEEGGQEVVVTVIGIVQVLQVHLVSLGFLNALLFQPEVHLQQLVDDCLDLARVLVLEELFVHVVSLIHLLLQLLQLEDVQLGPLNQVLVLLLLGDEFRLL